MNCPIWSYDHVFGSSRSDHPMGVCREPSHLFFVLVFPSALYKVSNSCNLRQFPFLSPQFHPWLLLSCYICHGKHYGKSLIIGIFSKSQDFMSFVFLALETHIYFTFKKGFPLPNFKQHFFWYFKCICKFLMLLEFKTPLKTAAHSSFCQEIFMYIYS